MKKILLLAIAFISFSAPALLSQSVNWAHNFGGLDNDGGNHIATDAGGNTYVTGYFTGTAFFDPQMITSLGGKDAFLVKYNSSGNVQWAYAIGGTGNDEGSAICVDANDNIYVSGFFASPSISTTAGNLVNSGGDDIFFLKYNSSGTLLNAAKAGGPGYEKCLSIATDASGNLYTTGYIAGTQGCSFGTTLLTGTGVSSMFIAKYNSSLAPQWATKAGGLGASGNVRGTSIAVDFAGAPFVTGSFLWGADFVVQQFTALGNTDMFLARYFSNNGNLNAAYQYHGTSAASRINPTSLKMDGSGFCNIAGYFNTDAVLGSTTLTSAGMDDIFLTRINAVGNPQWAVSAGGAVDDRAFGLTLDGAGNSFIAGTLNGAVNFGSISALGNGSSQDAFVAKYNGLNAAWQWAVTGGSPSAFEYAYDIAINGPVTFVITGEAGAVFSLGGLQIDNAGFNDGFVAEFSTLTGINDWKSESTFAFSPNPASSILTFTPQPKTSFTFSVYNYTGLKVIEVKNQTSINVAALPRGIYIAEVRDGEKIMRQKFVKE